MSNDVLIPRASPAEIDEMISIDDDACALYDTVGLHFDIGPDADLDEQRRWLPDPEQRIAMRRPRG